MTVHSAGPRFGTDSPAAAWRPTPGVSRTEPAAPVHDRGRLRRPGGAQARAEVDPAWFWSAAVRDLGIRFDPEPESMLDVSRGPQWARWWAGAGFNYVAAAVDEPAAHRPHRSRSRGKGRMDRSEPVPGRAVRRGGPRGSSHGDARCWARGPGGDLYADDSRDGHRGPRRWEAGRHLHPHLLRLRRAGRPAGWPIAGKAAGHRRRLRRRGKQIAMKPVADAALADAPTVERCLVVRRLWADGGEVPWTRAATSSGTRPWQLPRAEPLASVRTHAEEPYMLIYTSGTTGRPKGAIHDHGGFPLKSAVDLAHCFDLQRGDVLFWFTDMGWMMGPWAGRRPAGRDPGHLRGNARPPGPGPAVGPRRTPPDHPSRDQPHRGSCAHGSRVRTGPRP